MTHVDSQRGPKCTFKKSKKLALTQRINNVHEKVGELTGHNFHKKIYQHYEKTHKDMMGGNNTRFKYRNKFLSTARSGILESQKLIRKGLRLLPDNYLEKTAANNNPYIKVKKSFNEKAQKNV